MNSKQLRKAMREGKRIYGTMITSAAPRWVEYLRTADIDFVFIDTEHIPLDRSQVSWMCQVFNAAHIAPIVRIPSPDPFEACMALDGGAAGIVAPYVENVEQVQLLRGAVRYRPLKGERLQRVLDGSLVLAPEEEDYFSRYNEDRMLIINCESEYSVNNLDRLLNVPDVDAVFIGPHDLSVNIGVPEQYDSPVFLGMVDRIIQACKKHRISVANHFSGDLVKQIRWAQAGMNIVLWNFDILRFVQAMRKDIAEVKTALGETNQDPAKMSVQALDI